MTQFGRTLRRLMGDRRGISSVEYALLLAVIGSTIAVAAGTLSGSISGEMTQAASCIDGTDTTCRPQ